MCWGFREKNNIKNKSFLWNLGKVGCVGFENYGKVWYSERSTVDVLVGDHRDVISVKNREKFENFQNFAVHSPWPGVSFDVLGNQGSKSGSKSVHLVKLQKSQEVW